ncbi:MAG: methyltransferase family protein [Planctomycetota bacterium]|jgi:protein-S-isoprenylcysteine O-methyltransferase Ste14
MLIVKGLLGGLFQIVLFCTCLLLPAGLIAGGTWTWDRALLFIGVYGFILEATILVLALVAPASLEARLEGFSSKTQPRADRIITGMLFGIGLAWFVFIPVDVFHLKLMPAPPLPVSVGGAGLILLGYGIMIAAITQNAFAKPIVEDQTERGQTVVDTGVYAAVRHPMYLGLLPFNVGIALWLESYAGVIGVLLLLAVLIARIGVEERTLRKTLPGYTEYMEKVRYRLIPFLW